MREYRTPKFTEYGTVADLTREPPSSPPGQGAPKGAPGKSGVSFDGLGKKR